MKKADETTINMTVTGTEDNNGGGNNGGNNGGLGTNKQVLLAGAIGIALASKKK